MKGAEWASDLNRDVQGPLSATKFHSKGQHSLKNPQENQPNPNPETNNQNQKGGEENISREPQI